ncbi:esterase family protein [Thiospirochaeta perfilievii]|uniref:Esterase family protein n=1 Tax=Thiospirochaeta perfilievii TaxID=252967 RepID=A0A5C1Q635_9SPIO|nr:alpha/beta hydrolase-fold protein [Thiospirochaeta perfilievii]QEN03435.1 esterase family protein [Thiospirochaeta perfilievii]
MNSIPTNFKSRNSNVTYGELIKIKYNSTVVGNVREANVILPPNYDPNTKYPVLYLLHGIGGDENEWLGGKPVEVIGNIINSGDVKPMITVIPNVRARKNDSGNPSDIFTKGHFDAFDNFINDLQKDLIPYIKTNYNILEGRENTAIAGLSMGGRESIYIGITLQSIFGYIGAFSPAFGLLEYSNNNVTENGLLNQEGFVLKDEFKDTLIIIIHGDADPVVRDEPFKYHMAFENNGVKHTFKEIPGDMILMSGLMVYISLLNLYINGIYG